MTRFLLVFAPLLEHQSPFLNNFEMIFEKLNVTFKDLDEERIFSIKIRFLCE
jgi:hypothetical protein